MSCDERCTSCDKALFTSSLRFFNRQCTVITSHTARDSASRLPMSDESHNTTFEKLVRPHFDRLYRLAFRLTGHKAEAEDLFQELLIKAYGKLDDLVTIEEPGSWLSRVMYNLFIDEQRRFARRRMHTVEEGFLSGDGLEGFAGTDNPERDQQRRRVAMDSRRPVAQPEYEAPVRLSLPKPGLHRREYSHLHCHCPSIL